MKPYIFLIILGAIVVAVALGLWLSRDRSTETVATETSEESVEEPEVLPTPKSTYFYPMMSYKERITNRGHGQATTLADSEGFACGGQFEGIHIGDDLEVANSELTAEVPVFAVADGVVRRAEVVGGYGGLIVIEHVLNGEIVTAYYGHVDLTLGVKAGEQVVAGQKVTVLGDNCTSETSNERKHLHFAIRKGSSIDVRGYLQGQSELSEWHDPTELLKQLIAAEPVLG